MMQLVVERQKLLYKAVRYWRHWCQTHKIKLLLKYRWSHHETNHAIEPQTIHTIKHNCMLNYKYLGNMTNHFNYNTGM